MTHPCPICGYPDLTAPFANYIICPCCGCEAEADDDELTHAELRALWMAEGCPWWSPRQRPPADWDGRRQVADLLESMPPTETELAYAERLVAEGR